MVAPTHRTARFQVHRGGDGGGG